MLFDKQVGGAVARLGEALEPVDGRDQDVADAAGFEFVHDLEPEFGAFSHLREGLISAWSDMRCRVKIGSGYMWTRKLPSLLLRASTRRPPLVAFDNNGQPMGVRAAPDQLAQAVRFICVITGSQTISGRPRSSPRCSRKPQPHSIAASSSPPQSPE